MAVAVLPRNEVQKDYTWNAESVFENADAWQAEYESLKDYLPGLARFEGQLGKNAAMLLEWMQIRETVMQRMIKLYFYAAMSAAVDTNDQKAAGMQSQAQGLYGQTMAAAAFAEPEILQIGLDTIQGWMQEEPELKTYAHYFDDLYRQQAHVRSPEVEQVLGLVADPFSGVGNTAEVLANSEMEFPPATSSKGEQVDVSQGSLDALLAQSDRELRRTAWENYSDTYLKFKNTLASSYITSVKQDVFRSRVRRYPNTLEASLFADNIPTDVFYNLIETFKSKLPVWHRYWNIRRKALGVDKLHTYDIWAPLTENEPTIKYQESVDMIAAGMQPLGSKYVETLRRGCLEQRWVDVYPNKGKRQGAFSFGAPGTYPFINMSYTDDIGSLSTLAHELGHSMHSYFTWENQPIVYSRYSLFVAEVASNFNQAMVRAHLLEERPDQDFQLALIQEAMDNFHRYFFIMPTLARFELEVHQRVEQGKGVTADDLISLMTDLYSEGYGGEMNIDPERIGITWAEFGHLYADYYVFQYATGISGANALAKKVMEEGESAAQDYLKFLSAGGSLYPLEALKLAGVDLTTPEPVEAAFDGMETFIDRLESIVESRS